MGRGAKHLQMIFSFVKIKPRLVEVAISYALKTIITIQIVSCGYDEVCIHLTLLTSNRQNVRIVFFKRLCQTGV